MNYPIVAHIKQITLACNYWLLIAKTHPLWTGLPKVLIRLIYWTIFEKHPAQIWHDRIFKEITSRPASEACIWRLCIPSGYGSTFMSNRLHEYYILNDKCRAALIQDGLHILNDREGSIGARFWRRLVITCATKFSNEYSSYPSVEYRELKL